VASRNDVGVTSTTRTGPSHGPGIRTTYSSPTAIPPWSPPTLLKRANSVGATRSGSAAMHRKSSSTDSWAPTTRAW
jgi:hypothetical protein